MPDDTTGTQPAQHSHWSAGPWIPVFLLVITAIVGVFAGVLVDRVALRPRHEAPFGRGGPPDGFRGGFRRGPGGPGDHGPGGMPRELSEELGLNDAQRTAVDSIMHNQMQRMHAVQEATRPKLD